MNPVSEIHINLFKNKKVAILCGAGISINSGIPTVIPLLRYLMRLLRAEEKDIDVFINSGFPFEATMETLKNRFGIVELLKVFDLVQPNDNHRLIAHLIKENALSLVITTNFDRNIESALNEVGLREGINYNLIPSLSNVVDLIDMQLPTIIKLHGSIDNLEDVLTTITKVANRDNYLRVLEALNKIFQNPSFESVVVWGYSFSDHFDIKPALANMSPCDKSIYYLFHENDGALEAAEVINDDPSLSKFRLATKMRGNLDAIVKNISSSCNFFPSTLKQSETWKSVVGNWINYNITDKGYTNGFCLLGTLFVAAGYCSVGRKYAELALQYVDNTIEGLQLKLDAYSTIGKSYVRDPNDRQIEKGKPYFEEAILLARQLQNDERIIINSANLASCYMMAAEYDKAEPVYRDVVLHYRNLLLTHPDRFNIADKQTGYQIMLAHCLAKQMKLNEALILYGDTLEMCDDFGIVANKELCTTGYAIARILNKEEKQALQLFLSAYPLAKNIGSADRIKSLFYFICSWKREVEGDSAAQAFYFAELDYVRNKTGMNKQLSEIPSRLL